MTEPPRPISVPPKRQPTKNARYFLMAALYISGCVLTIVSLVLLQIPALILWYLPLLLIPFVTQDAAESVKRWSFHLFKVYIGLTEQVFGSWVIISTWMFVPGSIIITGDAELMQESMQSVVIAVISRLTKESSSLSGLVVPLEPGTSIQQVARSQDIFNAIPGKRSVGRHGNAIL